MDNVLLLSRFLSIILVFFHISFAESNMKCLVCKQVIEEITSAIVNEDPRKTIQVGSFRIQPDGSQKKSEIKYAGSELHLNEILETVCNSMEDYAQAKEKETGKITLLNLSKDVEKLSTHELVPDPDLNRSLKYYCESFIEDYEDDILTVFKRSLETLDIEPSVKLCQIAAGYCSSLNSEESVDHEEL